MLQFLTESAVLTSLGGLVGVITGVIMAQLISSVVQIPVSISLPAIAVAVVFSTLIGVVFGMLPAVQAANLNPIEALRRGLIRQFSAADQRSAAEFLENVAFSAGICY